MKRFILSSLLVASGAVALAQEVPALYNELKASYDKSEFEACVKLAGQVDSFSASRKDTVVANSFYFLGDAYNQLGDAENAIVYWEREKKLREELPFGDGVNYSNTLYNLAYIYLQAGQYMKAGNVAQELLATDRKIYGESSDEYAGSIVSVADVYMKIDRLKDAERLLQPAIRRQKKNSVIYGQLLSKLGDLYSYTGQYAKAATTLQEAADVLFLEAGEESAEYISAATNLGILYMGQGKYPEAEEIFDIALGLIREDDPSYPAALNNQAMVYQQLGQLDRAEQVFNKIRALDSAAVGTSHPDFAITLSNLANLLCNAGKYQRAEVAAQEALRIQKKNNEANTVSYARKLSNLARIYQMSGQAQKAIPLLDQASSIYKKALSENSPEYATAMYNLGNAHWKSGKGTTAIKYLKSSASIRAKVLGKNHPKYAESMQKIAEYQWEQKMIKDAHKSFGEVFDNFYFQLDVTFPGLTEEEKSKFYYTNIKDAFEKFNSLAVTASAEDPALLGSMFNYHINTKGAIMYATEKVKKAIASSSDSTLIRMFDSWQLQKENIARAYSQSHDAAKMDSLIQAANALEKELTKRSAAFAGQFDRKRYTWQDVQARLQPGEAAVEVMRFKIYSPVAGGAFTENVSYAFLVVTRESKEHPHLILVNNSNDLEVKFLKFYHNCIKYTLDDPRSYKNYFEPLASYMASNNIKKFYFSPDGVYNQININSIQNPTTGSYLLDDYDIHLLTNTKELVERSEKNVQLSSVLIGFPKFNLTKGTDQEAKAEAKITRGGNLSRGMRGGLLRYMRGDEGISELPGTQKEIQDISKLFNAPRVFLEREASEDIAKQVDNPGYLHFATHGYFLEDDDNSDRNQQYVTNPLLKAGLILAGSENFLVSGTPVNAAGDDGILTAYEAMNLRLDNTRLVVLSACETGLGKVKNGEGVYGLQRAFKLAGAQSIVMSLWNVDDDATQELMSTFYAELLKSGNQHDSFRKAQLKIKEKYKKPFYWGAFIMVGI